MRQSGFESLFQFQLVELPKVVLWVFRLDLVVKWS